MHPELLVSRVVKELKVQRSVIIFSAENCVFMSTQLKTLLVLLTCLCHREVMVILGLRVQRDQEESR